MCQPMDVLENFPIPTAAVSCQRHGCGHINETYQVVCQCGTRYILQKINHHVFKDVSGLMENISAITDYLSKQEPDPRKVLTLVPTKDGKSYYESADGCYWRVYVFVENSICLEQAETPEDFYESAVAFGNFQQMLKDFPAHILHETIPNFHDTRDRYRIFHEILEKDPMGRKAEVAEQFEFALAREEEAATLVRLLEAGQLPLRVTLNDTKLNNVMMDADTRTALCVIDLDTVMPGLSLYDYGDAIRYGAASAAEDETDLSKMQMRLDLFEIFTKGYLLACPDLTPLERQLLPLGAKLMTLECGVRFLTDYLDGDHYFSIHRPGHNLDRAKTQFKLVADMEEKWEEMDRIVRSFEF